MRIPSYIFAAMLFASAVRPACASTIVFSNLVQPGDQYGPDGIGIGHTPAFTAPGGFLIAATRFTPAVTSVLASIDVPLVVLDGLNVLYAYLMSDSGGIPGSVLEAFPVPDLSWGSFPAPIVAVPSGLHPVLRAGTNYWFAVTGDPQTFGEWSLTLFVGNSMSSANFATSVVDVGGQSPWSLGIGGPGAREGALRVLGDPVPEPASMILVAAGLLAGAARVRRSSKKTWGSRK